MNFQTEYTAAMDRLHASEETIKEVRRMNRTTYETGGKRKLLRPIWIVAALLAFCTVALAATYKLWSPGLASHFGADEAAQEAMLESGMTSLTGNPSVTLENGLTLTVEQTLCNGVETIVVVRYDAPEAGWFTWKNQGMATMYTFPSLTVGETEFGLGGGGFDNESVEDQTAYMIWRFAGDATDMNEQTTILTLTPPKDLQAVADNMQTDPEDPEIVLKDPLILPEEITLSWTLDLGSVISEQLAGVFSGEYNGNTMTIENVILTPISIQFTMTEGLDMVGNPAENPEALYPTGIVLTDGTTVGWTGGHLGEVDAVPVGYEPETLPGYYTFDTAVLDLDSIAGITFAAWSNTPVDPEVGDVTVFTLPLK